MSPDLAALLSTLARELIGEDGLMELASARDGPIVTFALDVEAPYIGRIIGKHGRTIQAIQLLMRAIGARRGVRVDVTVQEVSAVNRSQHG